MCDIIRAKLKRGRAEAASKTEREGNGMNLEELRIRKKILGWTNEELAKRSGIPLSTVQKLMAGQTKSPRYETMAALERALAPRDSRKRSSEAGPEDPFGDPLIGHSPYYYHPEERGVDGRVKEHAQPYKARRQGEYTVEDLDDLPENWRGELIDGVIYDQASPTSDHQRAVGWIHWKLYSFVEEQGGDCEVFSAPTDVRTDRDEKTVLVPDVFVLCDPAKDQETHIEGAPDLVVEVLSTSTRRRDLTVKVEKYRKAGVREYWAVDLKNERVIAYRFEEDEIMGIYSFQQEIPVGIWDGACALPLPDLKGRLKSEDVSERL